MTDTRKLFGTDGVRGVANVYPMTAEVALQLGVGTSGFYVRTGTSPTARELADFLRSL